MLKASFNLKLKVEAEPTVAIDGVWSRRVSRRASHSAMLSVRSFQRAGPFVRLR